VGCSEETIADGQGEETREEKRSQEEVSFRRVRTSQAKLRFKKKRQTKLLLHPSLFTASSLVFENLCGVKKLKVTNFVNF
jgi:hypothetical protein